ncbi:ABC transporter permease [Aliiroseovarius sp. 2305UL8-7]|uniref:ABC transporter permease n=1 Tax=Aliiroseovarius conchicola TaxID=3121637 RepID=UPI0035297D1C
MFEVKVNRTRFEAAVSMMSVIYHATVFGIRKTQTNAIIALLVNITQTLMLVAVFFVMMSVMGLRGSAVRGDFLLYILSGVFMFMSNIKVLNAVFKAASSTSALMLHSPMNTLVSIISTAIGSLYIQVLSVFCVLSVYSLAVRPIEIYDPAGAFAMLLLAWFNGISVGVVFLALRPWFPQFTEIATTFYTRANMFASGKMLLGNTIPSVMLVLFTWNPLFHIIDQTRGYVFINYNPHYSNATYPLVVSCVLLVLGMMGESYTRRHASISWSARQ